MLDTVLTEPHSSPWRPKTGVSKTRSFRVSEPLLPHLKNERFLVQRFLSKKLVKGMDPLPESRYIYTCVRLFFSSQVQGIISLLTIRQSKIPYPIISQMVKAPKLEGHHGRQPSVSPTQHPSLSFR